MLGNKSHLLSPLPPHYCWPISPFVLEWRNSVGYQIPLRFNVPHYWWLVSPIVVSKNPTFPQTFLRSSLKGLQHGTCVRRASGRLGVLLTMFLYLESKSSVDDLFSSMQSYPSQIRCSENWTWQSFAIQRYWRSGFPIAMQRRMISGQISVSRWFDLPKRDDRDWPEKEQHFFFLGNISKHEQPIATIFDRL